MKLSGDCLYIYGKLIIYKGVDSMHNTYYNVSGVCFISFTVFIKI